ncbi:hypothetical protein B0H63DRAFT_408742 [Podospora didyma]|uniref:Rhodopsin domain-containing protein n=1 Tax=Podospora didyma TaxID=330526 RepID=A0AAE0U8V6_9PEZI|nr:hypothetical protein B0H63DRAFT_408742 [Podospora didyma]
MSESSREPSPMDAESRFTEILAILAVTGTLSSLVIAMRCYARISLLRFFGLDDGVMLAAQVLNLAATAVVGLEAHFGLGRHAWTMPEENYIPYMKSFYFSIIFYNLGMCLTKISILLQFRRIFSAVTMQTATLYGLYFLIAWGITLSCLLPLVCYPVRAFWDTSVSGRCLDQSAIWYVMAGVNLVSDFALVTMPLPAISSLKLPKQQKILLFFVFTIGIFPCAVSIYRIKTLRVAAVSQDPTWDNVNAATFSVLELSIGVIAACLPTLRPIIITYMPTLFGTTLRSTTPATGRGTIRIRNTVTVRHSMGDMPAKGHGRYLSIGYGTDKMEGKTTEKVLEAPMNLSRGGLTE